MARTSISENMNEIKSFETVLYSGDAVVQRFGVCPNQVLKCGEKAPFSERKEYSYIDQELLN